MTVLSRPLHLIWLPRPAQRHRESEKLAVPHPMGSPAGMRGPPRDTPHPAYRLTCELRTASASLSL